MPPASLRGLGRGCGGGVGGLRGLTIGAVLAVALQALLFAQVPLAGPLLDHLLALVLEDGHLPLPLLVLLLVLLCTLLVLLPPLVLPGLQLDALLGLLRLALLDLAGELAVALQLLVPDVLLPLRVHLRRGVVLLGPELALALLLVPGLLPGILELVGLLPRAQGLGCLHVADLDAIILVLVLAHRLPARYVRLPLGVQLGLILALRCRLVGLLGLAVLSLLQGRLLPGRRHCLLLAELLPQGLDVVQH
mmetsp:Transcript_99176/g.251862  ORF Transcript_99176/g.251862 Transcript_99176/m.251862 type:complete len:249 (+) Transcript_99176:158-904(+)